MRPYESVSSIEMFLKCPHAYYLKYVKGYTSKEFQKTSVGKWVHAQLEKWAKGEKYSSYAQPFIDAVTRVISPEEVKVAEKAFLYDFNGVKLKGFIDVVADRFISDYKVTGSPSFYTKKSGFQPAIYRLVENKPFRYFLIEYDWDKEAVIAVHDEPAIYTDLLFIQRIGELESAINMIKACWKAGYFPPSWSNCKYCFMQHVCSENY